MLYFGTDTNQYIQVVGEFFSVRGRLQAHNTQQTQYIPVMKEGVHTTTYFSM